MFSALLHPACDCRRLFLRDYEVHINIGAFEHEKRGEQRVVINVDLFVPLVQSTPIDDRLHEVVDYDLMKQSVAQCRARHIHLQETLCDAIAATLLAHDAVRAVRVCTEKPDAYRPRRRRRRSLSHQGRGARMNAPKRTTRRPTAPPPKPSPPTPAAAPTRREQKEAYENNKLFKRIARQVGQAIGDST
jgi:dihydroneopterin aldolase